MFGKQKKSLNSSSVCWLVLMIIAGLLFAPDAARAAGEVDNSFAPVVSQNNQGIVSVAAQADGKILISGYFDVVVGAPRYRLVRVNADGTLDQTFYPFVDAAPNKIVVQPDGKILIGGNFTAVNGVSRNGIARLNADGTNDATFNPSSGANDVRAIAVQADGKILIGGGFSVVSGVNRNRIARLNADGSFDPFFEPGTGFQMTGQGASAVVNAILVQSDGKILVGGDFTSFNGISRNDLARLNADGSNDAGFAPLPGSDGTVYALTQQSDGKVLVGGSFNNFNGTACPGIARLNTNGLLDAGFAPAVGGTVFDVFVQSDGKILISGIINGGIIRFNTDGTRDLGFATSLGNFQTRIAESQADGRILFVGYSPVFGSPLVRIARFNPNNSTETWVDLLVGFARNVTALLVQSDGKIVVGGRFSFVNNLIRPVVARLNADGTTDASFNAPSIVGGLSNSNIYALAQQLDGKILVAGQLFTGGSGATTYIQRLNSDGSPDTTFTSPTLNSSNGIQYIKTVGISGDGKIYIGGAFTGINGVQQINIARLNSDGSLDTSFTLQTGVNATVNKILLQPDGKILVGASIGIGGLGNFRGAFERFNPNNTLDTTWNAVSNPGNDFALRADGKIIVGYDSGVYRVNAVGTTDTSFATVSTNNRVLTVAVQQNGKAVFGGLFSEAEGSTRIHLARANEEGRLDFAFYANALSATTQYPDAVNALAVQTDGKIVAGGSFDRVNNTFRFGVARVAGDALAARTRFDFNGDGQADLTVFRPGSGNWYISRGSNTQFNTIAFGQTGDKIAPADYDGDGKTDVAVFRANPQDPNRAFFYILQSANNSFRFEQFGANGDVPVSGDYDGDGRADIAVFRAGAAGGQSSFYYRPSSVPGADFRPVPWGTAGDSPVVADFDADGKIDVMVFRPSNGTWYTLLSADNSFRAVQFGQTGDLPTAADFNGDARAEIAVFRPSNGTWYRLNSGTGAFVSVQFGVAEDRPVPADYDGDGRADIAVWRPSSGTWYLLKSTAGFAAQQFGQNGDAPAEAAFVP